MLYRGVSPFETLHWQRPQDTFADESRQAHPSYLKRFGLERNLCGDDRVMPSVDRAINRSAMVCRSLWGFLASPSAFPTRCPRMSWSAESATPFPPDMSSPVRN
jgi:hypothetical protein